MSIFWEGKNKINSLFQNSRTEEFALNFDAFFYAAIIS